MMNECTKCDAKFVNELMLIGGYVAHLCADCRNKFTEYMNEHHEDKREEYNNISIEYDIAIDKGGSESAKGAMRKLVKLKKQLYEVTKSWVLKNDEAKEEEEQ